MNPSPRVTVVVPAYNAEAFLDETLRALRAQTLEDIEIIVVNDGSRDGTAALARKHAEEDRRVRVVNQPNSGVHAARNNGIRLARAPLVALSDADDVSLPERLERQAAFMDANPDVAALGTHGWRVGADGQELGVFDVGPYSRDHFARLRATDEPIYLLTSSAVFRRDLAIDLGGFRYFEGMAEDLDFWTRISDEHLVLTLRERLVRYRVHPKSASSTRFFRQSEDALLIRENAVRRRRGQPELSADEYHAHLLREPLPKRLSRAMRWRSKYYYRVAGGLLANRRPAGLWWLFLSFVTHPPTAIERLRDQVLPWLRARLQARRVLSAR